MLKQVRNNKIFQIVYKILRTIFFVFFGLYLVFILLQRVSNNASIFGYRIFNVASDSMKPVYEIGDVLLVKEVDSSMLQIGDDITYLGQSGDFAGKIITHRLIEIEQTGSTTKYRTKGIANEVEDPKITSDQIYGKASRKLGVLSMISKVVRNKFGFFFLIFIPLVLVLFLEVADTVMDFIEVKKEKRESEQDE